ncbi:hypothetical protein [Erwinia amylovora]|uniref:hypothetical protein n=1 Tax=Erwinia amylovora TaxID=552 RepID=UPI0005283732|nr:hypothetical protein [Erwinia amylovora]
MDKSDLISILSSMKIPRDSYSIGFISNESLCLIYEGMLWRIFYSERGQRTEEKFYASEEDACKEFLARLKHMLGY